MKKNAFSIFIITSILFLSSSFAIANEVEVVKVVAHQSTDKSWTFAVTLKHDDQGWDHYANEWQIIGADNKIYGTRTLYHPHVNEQPFTRNLGGVKIPKDVKKVRVIAKDTVHGLSSKAGEIDLMSKAFNPVTLELKKSK